MTTKPTSPMSPVQLPDPPEREPEDMTSFDHLTLSGSVHHLEIWPESGLSVVNGYTWGHQG